MATYPINQIRNQFPALNRTYNGLPAVYFDGPGGSQVVQESIDAIVTYMSNGGANLQGQFPTSRETENYILEAREIVADLLGTRPEEVAFGQNATSLAFSIARAVSNTWNRGDEIVLTEMDHPANIDSWLTVAKEKGVNVRWIKVDSKTCTLDLSNLNSIINEKTRLVAVTLASNAIGTISNIESISPHVKKVNALLALDAVHAVPHFAIDRKKLGADIILCSAYKFFGPHVGIAVIRKELFEGLNTYKVGPSPAKIPDKLETGTQNFSGISAIKPAIEFIEKLGTGSSRRERIISGYERIEKHENQLAHLMRNGLTSIEGVKMFQSTNLIASTPTIAFCIEGISPTDFCRKLAEEYAIFAADGHFYATRLADRLGVLDKGGWIRAGIAPYNTVEEVERFVSAVRQITFNAVMEPQNN
ncbi:cysteine desulfurase-like protein [Sporosarcina sp. G11-34]|uniref:cysteine desulfurase-like protein n=1 Tax=Sporosarcina sp. G11-34 TaxID=2849605 RepID=UPI0022A9D667|nr:cysteine desulfurase-like protein [Sporosarcina sp. G11-34]MCZ2258208.1 cysteine desulfurase-like protein [Sporosarcina sp. G11-34]